MPGFDKTGPMGLGPGSGGGQGGSGGGRGSGQGDSGGGKGGGQGGRGRGGGGGMGPGGNCICPSCGEKIEHQQGIPCAQEKCPKCGSPMTREM